MKFSNAGNHSEVSKLKTALPNQYCLTSLTNKKQVKEVGDAQSLKVVSFIIYSQLKYKHAG